MGATAQLDQSGPAWTTRTRSPYFSPKKRDRAAFSASAREVSSTRTGESARIAAETRSSTVSSSSRVTAAKWLKSNRNRSGATSEPCCFTCSPRTVRNAQCNRCVAV